MVLEFRAFRLSKSAFLGWDANTNDDEGDLISKLEAQSKNVGEATDDDLLFELLLKDGLNLTTKIEQIPIQAAKSTASPMGLCSSALSATSQRKSSTPWPISREEGCRSRRLP